VGLTLLAWGGSLGDLFGNAALARRGHASTALTACFAGELSVLFLYILQAQILSKIPPPDLISYRYMFPKTRALTFALRHTGPLFNMLIGLALGFSSRFAHEGNNSMTVQLTADVAVGCICLLIYNVVVAVVGIMNGFKLPSKFYLFARAWYCVYLSLACTMGLAQLWT
jgi:sodium/potassium/calcium exchanger 6